MAAPNSTLLVAITVSDTQNKYVRAYGTGGWVTVTLTNGEYYVHEPSGRITESILYHMEQAVEAATSEAWTFGVTSSTSHSFVRIKNNVHQWYIDHDYGATSAGWFDFSLLGFDTASFATLGAASDTYQTAYWPYPVAYWPTYPVAEDTHMMTRAQVRQYKSLGGKIYTYKLGAEYWERRLRIEYESYAKTFGAESSSGLYNDCFARFLTQVTAGQKVLYLPDTSSPLSAYPCYVIEDTLTNWTPQRLAPGVDMYGWTVGLLSDSTHKTLVAP